MGTSHQPCIGRGIKPLVHEAWAPYQSAPVSRWPATAGCYSQFQSVCYCRGVCTYISEYLAYEVDFLTELTAASTSYGGGLVMTCTHSAVPRNPKTKRAAHCHAVQPRLARVGRAHTTSWAVKLCCSEYQSTYRNRKEERTFLFNDAPSSIYLRLYRVGHMVKGHSDS